MKTSKNKIHVSRDAVAREIGDKGNRVDLTPNFENGTMVVEHMQVLNQMLKAVATTAMEDGFKEILVIRLTNHRDESTKILMRYANTHGIRLTEILKMEEYAKEKVRDHLAKESLNEIVGRFNMDKTEDKKVKANMSNSEMTGKEIRNYVKN